VDEYKRKTKMGDKSALDPEQFSALLDVLYPKEENHIDALAKKIAEEVRNTDYRVHHDGFAVDFHTHFDTYFGVSEVMLCQLPEKDAIRYIRRIVIDKLAKTFATDEYYQAEIKMRDDEITSLRDEVCSRGRQIEELYKKLGERELCE
jgi:hypothetical protein